MSEPGPDSKFIADSERKLLADGLMGALPPGPPRKRKQHLRKVEDRVNRSWVSAGCYGETVQWYLPADQW